jgi:hypothetical protein
LTSSQITETGTTERISGMRDLGGEEMLAKLALAVWFAVRCSLKRVRCE